MVLSPLRPAARANQAGHQPGRLQEIAGQRLEQPLWTRGRLLENAQGGREEWPEPEHLSVYLLQQYRHPSDPGREGLRPMPARLH